MLWYLPKRLFVILPSFPLLMRSQGPVYTKPDQFESVPKVKQKRLPFTQDQAMRIKKIRIARSILILLARRFQSDQVSCKRQIWLTFDPYSRLYALSYSGHILIWVLNVTSFFQLYFMQICTCVNGKPISSRSVRLSKRNLSVRIIFNIDSIDSASFNRGLRKGLSALVANCFQANANNGYF